MPPVIIWLSHRIIYSFTRHSCPVALVSDSSIMFSCFCNISEHVGKHSGVGVGCFASDGSGKICGVLCGVQAGGKFFASVRSWLTVADRPAAVAADLAACACASFTASSRAITRPCSIIRAAVWALTSWEDSALSRSAHFFASPCHSRHYRR